MLSRKNRLILLKLLSLFSVVRGYNILVITVAQYLTSIYILAPNKPLKSMVFDGNLFMLVTASALAIAGGYIINNFYDSEKDLINRPKKSMLDRLVSQRTKLTGYFVLNFLSAICASYVSFRALIFFSFYIFGIWFYSHKLKRMVFVGNLVSAMLAITPFFAVFVYYKNFDLVIFVHATFLFLLILIREMIKDLENIQGDLLANYKTIPIKYGEKVSKRIIFLLVVLTLVPFYLLTNHFSVGYMYLYFYVSIVLLIVFTTLLFKSSQKKQYVWLHNILKIIIVLGVFSILLIDVDVVLNRIL
jgi:4-hydroxybenzoate polyprenyltransferase